MCVPCFFLISLSNSFWRKRNIKILTNYAPTVKTLMISIMTMTMISHINNVQYTVLIKLAQLRNT